MFSSAPEVSPITYRLKVGEACFFIGSFKSFRLAAFVRHTFAPVHRGWGGGSQSESFYGARGPKFSRETPSPGAPMRDADKCALSLFGFPVYLERERRIKVFI